MNKLKSANFSYQVDSYLNNNLPSNELIYIFMTPKVLRRLGLKNYPICMKQKVLRHIISPGEKDGHMHNIPICILKKLPQAIINPLKIIYSETSTKGESIVIVTNLKDTYERIIIISILINTSSQIGKTKFSTHSVTNVYGKKNINRYLRNQIKNNNLLYNKKESIIKEPALARVRFPESPNSYVINGITFKR